MASKHPFPQYTTVLDVQQRAFYNRPIRLQPDEQAVCLPGESEGTAIAELDTETLAALVYKDTAVYDLAVGERRRELFEALWDAWLPLRDQRMTAEDAVVAVNDRLRAWFAAGFKTIGGFATDAWTAETEPSGQPESEVRVTPCALEWLVRSHEALCSRAAQLVDTRTAPNASRRSTDKVDRELNATFSIVFIVTPFEDWQSRGCLLCCREQDASRFGLQGQAKYSTVASGASWGAWETGVIDAEERILREARRLQDAPEG